MITKPRIDQSKDRARKKMEIEDTNSRNDTPESYNDTEVEERLKDIDDEDDSL